MASVGIKLKRVRQYVTTILFDKVRDLGYSSYNHYDTIFKNSSHAMLKVSGIILGGDSETQTGAVESGDSIIPT